MIQAFISFITFGFCIVAITLGSSWLIDHREEIFGEKGESIEQLAKETNDPSDQTFNESNLSKDEEDKDSDVDLEEIKNGTLPQSDVSLIKMTILNGGAQKGEAGKLAQRLEEKGYKSIKVSNASSYTYSGITVYYTKDTSIAEGVKKTIESFGIYTNIVVKQGSKGDEISNEIVVIMGE